MSDWIGVTANLRAPGYHLHDDAKVPLRREVSAPATNFGREDANLGWTVSYTCPQCPNPVTYVVECEVELSVDSAPRADEVGWFHGDGPA